LLRAAAILIGVFVAVTLVAWAAGAANLGTAATFGQLAFLAALVWLVLRD
jgi:hypothetical protein